MAAVSVDRYAELHAGFRWHVPEHFNIAEVCCTRWARETPDAVAIRYEHEGSARPRDPHLRRAAARCEPPRECADAARRQARRPRRDRDAAALRDRGRAHRDLPARRGRDAAVDAVRPGRARIPAERQRGAGRDRRRECDRQCARRAAAVPDAKDGDRGRRRAGAGRSGLCVRAACRACQLHPGNDARGRRGRADLHQRHDRPAQGRADPAPRADRQPARLRREPELVSPGRRGVLVARGLGLDRRPDGCAAADAVLRPRDRRVPGPLLGRDRARADGAPPRHAHLSVPDRAEGDDEGGARTARALPVAAARHHERGRGGRRRGVRVVPRRARCAGQRDVRPDRDELHRRQLAMRSGRRAPAAWAGRTRATASR